MADPLNGVIQGGAASASTANVGLPAPLALGPQQDGMVSQLHGCLYENVRRKASFHVANQAGQTTTVGLATTYTGLCLSNPNGSGKLVIVDRVGVSFLVAFTAASAVGLMVGFSTTNVTHTTPATPRSNYIDTNFGTAGVALADTAATLPVAPVVHTLLGSGLTGAITTVPQMQPIWIDVDGGIVLAPGGYVAIYTSTASGTNGMLGSFHWHEVNQ
jgi:hypothetical protein